jgi:hypothetical protein
MVGGAGVDYFNTGTSSSDTGDFVHSFDVNAEILCFGGPNGFFAADDIDTIAVAPDCPPAPAAATKAGTAGVVTGNVTGNDGAVTTSSADR